MSTYRSSSRNSTVWRCCSALYDYFDGRDEMALFIGNVNVGDANLNGLVVKRDAIIIVEFNDYEGELMARQNGQWTCNGNEIKGGAGGKSVFEQLKNSLLAQKRVIKEDIRYVAKGYSLSV